MTRKMGAKNKGRGAGSDFRKGYRTGWARVENAAKGVTPRQSGKGKVVVSKRSREYRQGYYSGRNAARRFYK